MISGNTHSDNRKRHLQRWFFLTIILYIEDWFADEKISFGNTLTLILYYLWILEQIPMFQFISPWNKINFRYMSIYVNMCIYQQFPNLFSLLISFQKKNYPVPVSPWNSTHFRWIKRKYSPICSPCAMCLVCKISLIIVIEIWFKNIF